MEKLRTYSEPWDDYELLDAGGGKKLERWGRIITIRPELQAYFKSVESFNEWRKIAHWEFIESQGKWKSLIPNSPSKWQLKYNKLVFNLELTKFKHLGLFPEQRTNWDWISKHLTTNDKLLNLFAYTGAMSCISRFQGAETFHIDSVKNVITWARNNMESSKLMNIKWVHEDALKFVEREKKRGHQYDFIVMDPPAWGIGVKGEKWKIEDKIDDLLSLVSEILSPNGKLLLNTYSPQITHQTLIELFSLYFPKKNCELSELYMKSKTDKHLYCGNLLRVS